MDSGRDKQTADGNHPPVEQGASVKPSDDKGRPDKGKPEKSREERLADALRANLRRRKSAAKSRED